MATTTRLPSGSWRARVFYKDADGKRHQASFTAKTKREAEYKAAEFEMEKERLADSRNFTLAEALDAYIDKKRSVLSPATIQGYEKIRRNNFQALMDVPIRRISSEMLQAAVQDELEKKPHHRTASTMSSKSVKNAYGLIISAIRLQDPRAAFVVDFPKTPRRIRTLPTPSEIYGAVKDTDIELPVLLAMWLSLTESEIRGLTKSRSIEGNYLTVREVVIMVGGSDVRKDMAKTTTRNRRLRMPDRIKDLINQVDGDVIVPMSPSQLLKKLKRYLKAAEVPEITFHDLRHVNASVMAALRIPDKYAQERGGWSTDHVMKQVYTETFSPERERVDRIIDEYFEQALQ